MGDHRLRFGENIPGRTHKSEKIGFVSGQGKVSISPKILRLDL